ncbi:hypothetical protein [Flavobacteriaceae bacterium 14752]|uniref:hypothetical protein n=1 Tax=Mesohalobacter salilacus TaxID=2491711 RepID=UPI000F639E25|nr:hypothetical protein EIG84_12150 [Flavobacteriaceae bacterium 14752]
MELLANKPITEQLNLRYPLRAYLDDGSNEFNSTPIEEKVNTLARLVDKGFGLNDVVKHYKQQYSLPGYKHILDNLDFTLKEYISFLATGNIVNCETFTALEEASDREITKLLTELLKEFILKEYSATSLVLSYIDFKYHNEPKEYKKISGFLNIDFDSEEAEFKHFQGVCKENNFNEEAIEKIYNKGEGEFEWDNIPLFKFLKEYVLPDLGKVDLGNRFGSNERSLSFDEEGIRGGPKSVAYFINKHIKNKARISCDSDYRKSCLLKLSIDLVEILYFDKPLFDYNVFHIKNEFMREGFIEELFDSDQAALLVEGNFREIENNPEVQKDEVYRKNKLRFIGLWGELNASLRQKDTLIVASYRGHSEVKIGLIKNCSQIEIDPLNPAYRTLQLTEVKTIIKKEHVILDWITRSRFMLNKITDKSDYITSKYFGKKPNTTYENLSDYSIKLMCMEWLRTRLAPKQYRIKYLTKFSRQLMTNVDIYGLTADNKVVAAKVIFLNQRDIIQEVLNQFHQSKKTLNIVFSEIDIETSIHVYNTKEIFNQLYESKYRCFLANLVGD